jgi:putative oxidoreductase
MFFLSSSSYANVLLFLRLVLGVILMAHGWPKIKNMRQTAHNFNDMGFRPGMLWGMVVAFLEFFGGILLLLGLGVRTISFFLLIQFVVIIIWKLVKRMPFVGGWEFDFVILAVSATLLAFGPGLFSLSTLVFGF